MSASRQSVLREMLAGPVNDADRQLLWTLAGLAAVGIALAAYLSLFPRDAGFLYFIAGIMFASAACVAAVSLRLKNHDYSPAGILWLMATIGVFEVWTVVVMGVSLMSRWWAHGQPGYHVGVSAIVGLAPLLISIWVLGRKLRKAS
jgi:hypothetical protein